MIKKWLFELSITSKYQELLYLRKQPPERQINQYLVIRNHSLPCGCLLSLQTAPLKNYFYHLLQKLTQMMVMPFRELYGANEIVIRFIPFSDAYWKKKLRWISHCPWLFHVKHIKFFQHAEYDKIIRLPYLWSGSDLRCLSRIDRHSTFLSQRKWSSSVWHPAFINFFFIFKNKRNLV